jgi:hypothetical protein
MIILETLWDIIQSVFITILVLDILYGIGEFFNWVEYKRFEKDMTKYLKQKHKQESLERYSYDLHLQYMMREWNW